MAQTANQWDQIDDFKWLQAEPSPNFSLLPAAERVEDRVWKEKVPGGHGDGLDQILKAVGVSVWEALYVDATNTSVVLVSQEDILEVLVPFFRGHGLAKHCRSKCAREQRYTLATPCHASFNSAEESR
jgi:hypothetical protein